MSTLAGILAPTRIDKANIWNTTQSARSRWWSGYGSSQWQKARQQVVEAPSQHQGSIWHQQEGPGSRAPAVVPLLLFWAGWTDLLWLDLGRLGLPAAAAQREPWSLAGPSLGDFARLPRYQAGDKVPHNIANRISSCPLVGGRASPDGPFLLLLDVVKHCVVPFYDGLDVGWYGGTFSVR